jgi:CRISPR/Cas system-associated protein Cas10 (large subunit of type III CRISPR-Cas system)
MKDETLKEFIDKEVKTLHKKVMLESELSNINKELSLLKEGQTKDETPQYQKNVYEGYEKNIEDVVSELAKTASLIESCIAKQRAHQRNIPEVAGRMDESKNVLEMLIEMFKDVKGAKLKAEKRMYEK